LVLSHRIKGGLIKMVDVEEVTMEEKEYEEYLNDCFGDVTICGMKYSSGWALRQLDEIAFNCGLSEQEIKYKCGKCEKVYDDEEEAEKCCKED
jgi:hypothetical protein